MKRLIKVFGEELSGPDWEKLPAGASLNVVLKSGNTLFGRLLSQTPQAIRIQDSRFYKHELDVSIIDVIVYDYVSSY